MARAILKRSKVLVMDEVSELTIRVITNWAIDTLGLGNR
jgi:ABC-type branched-subunit amino acid transport system ATPase component